MVYPDCHYPVPLLLVDSPDTPRHHLLLLGHLLTLSHHLQLLLQLGEVPTHLLHRVDINLIRAYNVRHQKLEHGSPCRSGDGHLLV